MKTVFISRYGSKNLGDELIVRELEKLLSRYSDEILRFSFNLTKYNSLEEAFEYPLESLEVTSMTNEYSFYKKYIRNNKFVSIFRNYINKKKALKNAKFNDYSKSLNNADVLIIGGGNAIFDTEKYSSSAYYFGLMLEEALKQGKPIFVINVGIGPFQTRLQVEKTIEVLKKANYITVRDRKSYDIISDLNEENEVVYQTIDPVVFLDCKKRPKDEVQTIGINIMDLRLADYSEETYIKYLNNLKSVITYYLDNTKYDVCVFCTEKLDSVALQDLKSQMGTNIDRLKFINFMDVNNTLNLYENIDVLVGTRMHSTIISMSQNTPFVGIGWQQKVFGFFESIKRKEDIISLDEFTHDYSKIIVKLDSIINNYPNRIEDLKNIKVELKETFDLNEDILKRLHPSINQHNIS